MEYAQQAVADGFDAVVAQDWGSRWDAGGLPTFVLVPELRDALGDDVLLMAAGGVSDGRTTAAALCLGADAVWVGTRLCATREANTHPEHHRRLLDAGELDPRPLQHLRSRNAPLSTRCGCIATGWCRSGPTGWPVPTVRDVPVIGQTMFLGQPHTKHKFDVILPTNDTTGDFEEMAWLMGQGVGLIHSIEPAAEVVATMMSQAEATLAKLRCSSGSGRAVSLEPSVRRRPPTRRFEAWAARGLGSTA